MVDDRVGTVNLAQLEIVAPSGEITFYDLDPAKGITNIGRHQDNDVVIDSPDVAMFHAMLDHRQFPFYVVRLSQEGGIAFAGQALGLNVPVELSAWDAIELDGYKLLIVSGDAPTSDSWSSNAPVSATIPAPPGEALSTPVSGPRLRPSHMLDLPVASAAFAPAVAPSAFVEEQDDFILVELSARDWTTNVDQPAICQVTVINGGSLVATFHVRVLGIDENWINISSEQVNLNEGSRQTVSVSIQAPRLPTSEARTYPLAIEVTSHNYPGHVSRAVGSLTINPYHEFSLGELSPKQQTVHWLKRVGRAEIPVTNKGNSEAVFRLEAEDTERACHFEFEVPGESVNLTRQAEMRLLPGVTETVPVWITPPRRLVALRRTSYSYTLTTLMTGSDQIPRSVMGQVRGVPLIGPFLIALMVIGLVFLTGFLFSPNREPELDATPRLVQEPGGAVSLGYDASRFALLGTDNLVNRLNGLFLRLSLEYKADGQEWQVISSSSGEQADLEIANGQTSHTPRKNGYYQLYARTWVSDLIPLFEGKSGVIPVFVEPVEPRVTFMVDRNPILAGETINLRWEAEYAENLVLEQNGIQETLPEEQIQKGQYSIALNQSTTFALIATNSTWENEVRALQQIEVLYPTPVVIRFDASPQTIAQGESVRLNWEVEGAEGVSIDPLGNFPIKGDTSDQPPELRRYRFVAYKNAPDGSRVESEPLIKEIHVNTPTPTPAPPEIQVFDVIPKQVILGDNQQVNLRWQVVGQTTNVEINAPNIKLPGLDPQDPDGINVTVDETTLFILTAYNGELSTSAPIEVTVLEPTPTTTPTATPTATPTPTPTPTPFPPPVITYFRAEVVPGQGEVTFRETTETGQGPMHIYDIEVGSDVNLLWNIEEAERATLDGQAVTSWVAAEEERLDVTQITEYELAGYNNSDENVVREFIRVEPFSPPPPPPPRHVRGEMGATTGITLTWSYSQPPETIQIDGFRVYGTRVVNNDFLPLPLPTDPDPLDPTTLEYYDSAGGCGWAYYVVAVFQAIENDRWVERETDASASSWYSDPCP